PAFFTQVRKWYGNNHDLHWQTDPPPASAFNLNDSARTHYEGFFVYVPHRFPLQDPGFVAVPPPDFSPFLNPAGTTGPQAALEAPLGFGAEQFLPLGQPLPYTVRFRNAPDASSTVGEVRIVETL